MQKPPKPHRRDVGDRLLHPKEKPELEVPSWPKAHARAVHRTVTEDLHSVERTVTLAGNVRYAAPREAGSHADRWTALVLALHAADTPPTGASMFLSAGRCRRRDILDGWGPTPTLPSRFHAHCDQGVAFLR